MLNMKSVFKYGAPILVILIGFIISNVLHETAANPEKNNEKRQLPNVDVALVAQKKLFISIESQGEVSAKNTLSLISQVSGKVLYMHPNFSEGGAIEENETILQIEQKDYQLDVIRKQAVVAAAELEVEESTADKQVADSQLGSGKYSALARKIPQKVVAKANLDAAKADLEFAQLSLERTNLILPYGTRVSERLVGLNQYVAAGTAMATLYSTDVAQIKVSLTDYQLDLLNLPAGYSADSEEGIEVRLSAQRGQRVHVWYGKLVRLDAAVESTTRLLHGYVEVPDPYEVSAYPERTAPLAIGQYVMVNITAPETTSVLSIPVSALRSGDKVYVIEGDRLHIKTVDVLRRSEQEILIKSGLEVGEQVALTPMKQVLSGMKVSVNPRLKGQANESGLSEVAKL